MSGAADHLRSDALPSDPVELRTFAEALLERCEKLERLLKLANALRHGPSSEKIHPDQLQLGLEDIDQAVGAADAHEDRKSPPAREKRAAARRANRGKLPEHLPRVIETLAPAETVCPCCQGELHEIGVDESQRLDVVPAQLRLQSLYPQGQLVDLGLRVPASLALFVWLLTLHPTATGRVYAAYGGVYVAVAIVCLWLVDGVQPTRWDLIGAVVAMAGMAIIMSGPRAA